jgi:hypothetical protein
MMKLNGFLKEFTWMDRGKPCKTLVTIPGFLSEILTEVLTNKTKSKERDGQE